jgi:hypothetical protein
MRVNVTAKHIKRGKRGNPSSCPIAQALQDTEMFSSVRVYNTVARVIKDGYNNMSSMLPKKAQQFIHDFDTKKKVKPFRFNAPGLKRS